VASFSFEKGYFMLHVFSHLFACMACFGLGRMSYLVMRNRYLEDKKQELLSYHAELLAIEENLEARDKQIRQKWQNLVDDISKYQAMVGGFENGKWTDMDDVYLNSWKSAEE